MQPSNDFRKKGFILFGLAIIAFIGIKLLSDSKVQNTDLGSKERREDIKAILYTRDGCRYCVMAKDLLITNNIPFEAIDISVNTDLQQKLVDRTGQTTVPYVFINGEFLGGYQNLADLKAKGGL